MDCYLNKYLKSKSEKFRIKSFKDLFIIGERNTKIWIASILKDFEMTKSAFTLAEVLITLGIIGVVAVLTLPALISKHKTQVSVEALKKTYSALSQAYKMAEIDNGEVENWDWSLTHEKFFNKYFVPYLNITKNCGQTEGCWSKDGVIYSLNGSSAEVIKSADYAKIQLFDGTLAAIQIQNNHAHLYVDTNGIKPPNTHGKDIFLLTFTKGPLVESGLHDINKAGMWFYGTGMSEAQLKSNCKYKSSGTHCGAYLYTNGWKIPSDYPNF